jgi:hypothetical protein
MTIYFKTAGDQQVISQDSSLLRRGSHSVLASGNLYSLLGDYCMGYDCHNTAINPATGNFAGLDDSGTATLIVFTEGLPAIAGNSLWQVYSSPFQAAGSAPNFAATPCYSLNLQSGSVTSGSASHAGGIVATQMASPGTPVGTPSTSGGTVAAGSNYCKVVGVDANGNVCTPSTESAAVTTTGTTSSIVWQANPSVGAVSYQFWLGTSSNGETHYATSTVPYYVQTLPASSLTSGTINAYNSTGQVVGHGDTSGASAAAGNVGELIIATVAAGSAVALSVSGTSYNLTSLALTIGEWDVSFVADFIPAATTSITLLSAMLGIASATALTQAGQSTASGAFTLVDPDPGAKFAVAASVPGANVVSLDMPPCRVKMNASGTLYCVCSAAFSVSTISVYGTMRARRVR